MVRSTVLHLRLPLRLGVEPAQRGPWNRHVEKVASYADMNPFGLLAHLRFEDGWRGGLTTF